MISCRIPCTSNHAAQQVHGQDLVHAAQPSRVELAIVDGAGEAGYERRLFEATKLYSGKEDKAQTYPNWKVWIDPSLGSEVATLQTKIENYVQECFSSSPARRT